MGSTSDIRQGFVLQRAQTASHDWRWKDEEAFVSEVNALQVLAVRRDEVEALGSIGEPIKHRVIERVVTERVVEG